MELKAIIEQLENLDKKIQQLVKLTPYDKFWESYFPYTLPQTIEYLKKQLENECAVIENDN